MTAQINYDFVTPEELTGYVRNIPFSDLALERILPSRELSDVEFRYKVGNLIDVDAAEFRQFDTPAGRGTRQGSQRKSGALPPISRALDLSEEDILRLRFLESGDPSGIISAIYDDARAVLRAIQVRLELARGEVLNTGKLVLNENGVVATVDYGRSAGHNVVLTGTNLWTDTANSKPITNLRTWRQTYLDDTGVEPGAVLMSDAAINNLYLNAEVRNLTANLITGAAPNLVTKAHLQSILDNFNLPPIVPFNEKFRVAGSATPVIPSNRIVMVPPTSEPLGHTLYGVTATAMHLATVGRLVASAMPGIVAVVTGGNGIPVRTATEADALSIPLLANPDLTFAATVG